ncbi:MAG: hypothetical protein Q4D98_06190 [Planctomycetia bacterium]|nr:hypothetical protein [Planctomycetia bacterium]
MEKQRISLFLLVLPLLAGCASNPFTEGAYIGSDGGGGSRCCPAPQQTRTSVPLIGSCAEKNDARNRVAMERVTGRPVMARPASVDDLLSWKQAGVADENVTTHIRIHGAYRPITPQEVLTLQQRGVSNAVIRTMQEHPYPKTNAPAPQPTNGSNRCFGNAPPTNDVYRTGGSSGCTTGSCGVNSTTACPVQGNGGRSRIRSSCETNACETCSPCEACGTEGYYIGSPVLLSDTILPGGTEIPSGGCSSCGR